jgi:hypothetical protein
LSETRSFTRVNRIADRGWRLQRLHAGGIPKMTDDLGLPWKRGGFRRVAGLIKRTDFIFSAIFQLSSRLCRQARTSRSRAHGPVEPIELRAVVSPFWQICRTWHKSDANDFQESHAGDEFRKCAWTRFHAKSETPEAVDLFRRCLALLQTLRLGEGSLLCCPRGFRQPEALDVRRRSRRKCLWLSGQEGRASRQSQAGAPFGNRFVGKLRERPGPGAALKSIFAAIPRKPAVEKPFRAEESKSGSLSRLLAGRHQDSAPCGCRVPIGRSCHPLPLLSIHRESGAPLWGDLIPGSDERVQRIPEKCLRTSLNIRAADDHDPWPVASEVSAPGKKGATKSEGYLTLNISNTIVLA